MEGVRGEIDNVQENEVKHHPLLFPEVLKVLFPMLPLKDLQSCRLVCKDWFEESLPSWWHAATLKFEEGEKIVRKLKYSTNTTTLAQYLEFCENECTKTPFKRLHISDWTFKAGDENQARFFELVGKHATSLTLFGCSFDSRDTFRKIAYQLLPNLKFLKLEACDFPSSDKDEYRCDQMYYNSPQRAGEVVKYQEPIFGVHGLQTLHLNGCRPDSMIEMLSHFHMLASIQIEGMYARVLEFLNAVKLIREKDPKKLPLNKKCFTNCLTDIDLNDELAECFAELNLYRELNLPVHRLRIEGGGERAQSELAQYAEIIMDHIQHHSPTLNIILDLTHLNGLFQEFPLGVQMEMLDFVGLNFVTSLDWLLNTPNLTRLSIFNYGGTPPGELIRPCSLFSNSSKLGCGNWTMPSLKNIDFCAIPICPDDMRKVVKWFPNVEEVEMELDDELFSIICEHWKQLKELTTSGELLTDQGITGITSESSGANETPIRPNIQHLTSLESLYFIRYKLTERSVYDGFLKVPSLRRIGLPEHAKIDAEARAALKRNGIDVCQF